MKTNFYKLQNFPRIIIILFALVLITWESSSQNTAFSNAAYSNTNNIVTSVNATVNGFTTSYKFTVQNSISLTDLANGAIDWGDYDNDGDLDLIIAGSYYSSSTWIPTTKIYRKNSNNSFTYQSGINIQGLDDASVEWGDYDNDGDLDILICGDTSTSSVKVTKVYKNNGNNTFSEQTNIILTGVSNAAIAWGDYDNDGDLDILLTGNSASGAISKVYRNSNGAFTEQSSISLTGVSNSSVAWGDYDNDGDLDILITGGLTSGSISKIYKNINDSTFTEQTGITLLGVSNGCAAWGDYDSDGDLDIVLSGNSYLGDVTKIYKNNGNNTFTDQASITLLMVSGSSVLWGDYDNDGDLDLLISGNNYGGTMMKVYNNNGNNTFTDQINLGIPGISDGDVEWGDYDNDGDLDVVILGLDDTSDEFTKLYRNNNIISDLPPSSPTNLQSQLLGDTYLFSWNKSTDDKT